MNLYNKLGYINIDWIVSNCDKNNISFIIIIGARQIGKTFGTLKYMIENNKKFILMRRTQAEADFINSGVMNPFGGIDSSVSVKKLTQYTGGIYKDELIGVTMALSTVSKIRGFSGIDFTDLVFDEFIPETHVAKIKNEDDAFLNAIITLSGNREIEGKPPLRIWLLANSNNFSSPILSSMGLQNKLEKMMNKNQEYSMMAEKGILLILPQSKDIISKRKQTSIYKVIDSGSNFSKMAFGNEFSYNDNENVNSKNLSNYNELFSVSQKFTVFISKDHTHLYVTKILDISKRKVIYSPTERGRKQILKTYVDIHNWYIRNLIFFDSLKTKTDFVNYFTF